MNTSPMRDLLVGLFVLAGLAALAYLSLSVGGLSYTGPGGLKLYATFTEIGGLRARAPVVIGGVKIGQVTAIELDEDYYAQVELEVDAALDLPDDTSAAILTQGVLGNQYIGLEPGASEDFLRSGDEIALTQDAVIVERLLGRVMSNLGEE
jgi:phospholipid/cholesterol/gamma-HCH transport system substrate-binding protein